MELVVAPLHVSPVARNGLAGFTRNPRVCSRTRCGGGGPTAFHFLPIREVHMAVACLRAHGSMMTLQFYCVELNQMSDTTETSPFHHSEVRRDATHNISKKRAPCCATLVSFPPAAESLVSRESQWSWHALLCAVGRDRGGGVESALEMLLLAVNLKGCLWHTWRVSAEAQLSLPSCTSQRWALAARTLLKAQRRVLLNNARPDLEVKGVLIVTQVHWLKASGNGSPARGTAELKQRERGLSGCDCVAQGIRTMPLVDCWCVAEGSSFWEV